MRKALHCRQIRVRPAASCMLAAGGMLLLCGCEGPTSTLDPAGYAAREIADLFWAMLIGAAVVWFSLIGLAIYAIRLKPKPEKSRRAGMLIIGGGAVLPTLVLAGYLVYGLALLPRLTAPPPEGSLQIEVTGEQWWWRIRYRLPNGEAFDLANEVHLPVGEPVEFILSSPDVIHSFWIPSIGGKMDMIPGRVTRLTLEPTRTGVFRGACAEYCGTSHAWMNFFAIVTDRADFDRWMAEQSLPAAEPTDPDAARGAELFIANGCGSCHTVRGTEADGLVGPDLTHVGGRQSIGAGMLPAEEEALYQWIAHTDAVKPDVLMPSFGMLPPADIDALAAYLAALQ